MPEQRIIRALNELIDTSRDAERGFRACAEHANSASLRQLFRDRAGECADAVRELQSLVRQLGSRAEASASAAGALQRGWTGPMAALSAEDDAAALAECERGENHAVAAYRRALDEAPFPGFVRRVIARQFEGAVANRDQLRNLREQFRNRLAGVRGTSAAHAHDRNPRMR